MTMHSKQQIEDVIERLRLASPIIYEIISSEGQEELSRPLQSLAWSGLVAGIAISFSLLGEGFLRAHLPPGGDFFLLENFGYTLGFLIVVLGRFQLFTENTVTVVLPLLEHKKLGNLLDTLKLWAVVLATNFAGTFLVAFLMTKFSFIETEQVGIMVDISRHAVEKDPAIIFQQAIPAGFLMASMVWMLPSSKGTHFWVIMLMSYLIAIGDFAHVVAGSAEAFLLLLHGIISVKAAALFLLAACAGNIVGGTGLFALLAYAQVKEEM
jgi:formate/nitrite transporter FocA (FNT family)